MDPATARVDLSTVHRCPSVPPSVPIGPPNVVVVHQPQLDRVLLEKKGSSGTVCICRGTPLLVRDGELHAPGEPSVLVLGGRKRSIL